MSRRRINRIVCIAVILFFSSIFCSQAAQPIEQRKESNLHNPFGVLEFLHWDHPWNSHKYATKEDLDKAAALMKEAGAGWVRIDFLWSDIEPKAGKFEFEKYDYIVDLLNKNEINILGLLDYSTDWASSSGKWNCPPQDSKLFINYASRVIERFKSKVKYWELWNEPDSHIYWEPQDGLKSYCALLKEVYTAAKKIDPDCKILNGGFANGISSLNKLYDNGAKDYFDILNIHIFESPLSDGALKRVSVYPKLAYKVMARNGDSHKKIWVTEIGCPGVKSGFDVKNWWLGKNPNEWQQAEWLINIYTELTKNEAVEKIFWAFFRDCKKHWDNGVDYFGIVRWDFSKKPAFSAYKDTSEIWRKSKK